MKYNFDSAPNRRGTNAIKWDVAENELPMWIADMDFATAPEIEQAIVKRAEHGVFGYSGVTDAWYEAYSSWWKERHGVTFEKDALIFCTGVIAAISSIVRKLTDPAEKIVLMTPVYGTFYNSILNNGRVPSESRLIYENGVWSIDFDDLERKLADPQASMLILCNPHNPSGRIWSKEELARVGDLCAEYGVTVISDEIHCDITAPGTEYVSFASVNDTCRDISVTCIAPTKTFNLAGLHTAAVYIHDKFLRHKVWRGLNTDEVAEPNSFAVEAAVAAFTEGTDWLEEMRAYVFENKRIAADFIAERLLEVHVGVSEATYLMWLDCSRFTRDAKALAASIRRETGLYLSPGTSYGSGGESFLRLNVACTRATLLDGLDRLEKGVKAFIGK